jgi:prepilin-type N-terminal cleavage/methylation domain-containing protein
MKDNRYKASSLPESQSDSKAIHKRPSFRMAASQRNLASTDPSSLHSVGMTHKNAVLSLLAAAFFWYPVFVLYVLSGSGNNPYAFYTLGDLFRRERFADFRAYKRAEGFTLVELAIVLVILGLLVGGVITGQNLIRAAELRSITTEFAAYQTAVMTFKDKYMALPGDMTNATDFWGAMTNCGVASPSGTGTQTCNGNGNGRIEGPSAAGRTGEMFTFWQQLANANLIPGQYTGIAGAAAAHQTLVGVNAPSSKLSTVS